MENFDSEQKDNFKMTKSCEKDIEKVSTKKPKSNSNDNFDLESLSSISSTGFQLVYRVSTPVHKEGIDEEFFMNDYENSFKISLPSDDDDEDRIDLNRIQDLNLTLNSSTATSYREINDKSVFDVENFNPNLLETNERDAENEMKEAEVDDNFSDDLEKVSLIGDDEFDLSHITDDDEEEFLDLINKEKEPKNKVDIDDISLDDIIAALPVDNPLLNMKFRPFIRDPEIEVKKMTITKDFQDVIVYISDVSDIAHFYFQPLIEELNSNYDKLQKSLNDEYAKLDRKDLAISEENFKKGLIVAVYFDNFKRWYRGKITNLYKKQESYVGVFFFDYGTYGRISKSSVKYLFEDYLKYPELCFRGRLYGIKPSKGKRYFDVTSVEKFLKKVSTQKFLACVVHFDESENAYELELIRCKDGLNLKQFVLNEKIGSKIRSYEYDSEICLATPSYLIPNFDMLEKGLYPTLGEIETFSNSDINFNTLIEKDFFHSVTRKELEKSEELQVILKHSHFALLKKYFYQFA